MCCNFLYNSIILCVLSGSILVATTVMILRDVRMSHTMYISLFMVSSLFFCASLTWTIIYLYAYPRPQPPREPLPRQTEMVISVVPRPCLPTEYTVSISSHDLDVAIGRNGDQVVLITHP